MKKAVKDFLQYILDEDYFEYFDDDTKDIAKKLLNGDKMSNESFVSFVQDAAQQTIHDCRDIEFDEKAAAAIQALFSEKELKKVNNDLSNIQIQITKLVEEARVLADKYGVEFSPGIGGTDSYFLGEWLNSSSYCA